MLTGTQFKNSVMSYLSNTSVGYPGRYRSAIGGHETLYASCFALMVYHYLNALTTFDRAHLEKWGEYILEHQDAKTGYFVGPEISQGRLLSEGHSREHLMEHLTVHVLPALKILGVKPSYPLYFAHRYLDPDYLEDWLSKRDWRSAWIEGNNLLFVGQLLLYLKEEEGLEPAEKALERLLEWLDSEIDPGTGLWGSNGYCDARAAMYGGYHQLILYYYTGRPVKHMTGLIDTTLSLQHLDGGFSESWGGGSCEDIDAVDILVNMYKRTDYRRKDIARALRRSFVSIRRRFTSEGGFVYKLGEDFVHMGMEYTAAPKGRANMFSTWFGVLTVLLISEIIDLPCTRGIRYNFNPSCSMGYHQSSAGLRRPYAGEDFPYVLLTALAGRCYFGAQSIREGHPLFDRIYRTVKRVRRGS
jgi:hypothetical protein